MTQLGQSPHISGTLDKNECADIQFIVVDLFCGAGGASTGLVNSGKCLVVAAVNHDECAIASHSINHARTSHFNEDVRAYDMLAQLATIVEQYRIQYPLAKVVLWASMECTNFSNAKGGKPREQDSRTLANVLFWYIEVLNPDYVWYENVREFLAWGPLDENGKPISRKNGADFLRWVRIFADYGYNHQYRILNSADYGARTSRSRLFGIFAKQGLPIGWPTATHCKAPKAEALYNAQPLEKWLPVKDVLELEEIGKSVFTTPKCDKTTMRIVKGIEKFGHEFIMSYFGNPENNPRVKSLDAPAPAITAQPRQNLVRAAFIASSYGSGDNISSVNAPCPTITAIPKQNVITPAFIHSYYSSGDSVSSLNAPAPTIPAMEVHSIVHFGGFIVNPQYSNNGTSLNSPAPTVIASQKGYPLSVAITESAGNTAISPHWVEKDTDSDAMRLLRKICREKGIADIFLRMLSVTELKRIQGFPDCYVLRGSLVAQKKQLGNAVHPIIAEKMAISIAEKLKTCI